MEQAHLDFSRRGSKIRRPKAQIAGACKNTGPEAPKPLSGSVYEVFLLL
jgi:hypothetical protein